MAPETSLAGGMFVAPFVAGAGPCGFQRPSMAPNEGTPVASATGAGVNEMNAKADDGHAHYLPVRRANVLARPRIGMMYLHALGFLRCSLLRC